MREAKRSFSGCPENGIIFLERRVKADEKKIAGESGVTQRL